MTIAMLAASVLQRGILAAQVPLSTRTATVRAIAATAAASQNSYDNASSSRAWTAQLAALALAGTALASVSTTNDGAKSEGRTAFIAAVVDAEQGGSDHAAAALASAAALVALAPEPNTKAPRTRRSLLKKRTQHTAKLEEVDLNKLHLDEYRANRRAVASLRSRFDKFASQTLPPSAKAPSATAPIAGDNSTAPPPAAATPVRAMTFTDFLHALVLPRFHVQAPRADVAYTCDFVGDINSLITYEECYLLLHLLQIPREHFGVAFAMLDLDGDGTVDKAEFCDVIEHLLRAITAETATGPMQISAEATLPRLTKYLFGRFGKKRITALELEQALDLLRKQILRAEFDLYAKPHPTHKSQFVLSVHDFALTLVSNFDPEKLGTYLDRVHALHASEELVTWDDFYAFHFHVQRHLDDIRLAFELTGAAEITETDFIRAARIVSGVELSFPVVQLAFRIFDSNENGTLDQSELLKVLAMRSDVQLEPKRPVTKLQQFWHCLNDSSV